MASGNPIQGPSFVDPMFEIPEGLANYQHSNVPTGDGPITADEEDYPNELSETEVADEGYVVDEVDQTEVPELDFPDTFSIVSQTIRTLPSGMQVVDVVVAVEDIPGAINYEVRVVKM